jgi:hypothetical protein
MRRRWIWFGFSAVLICSALLVAWQTGLADKAYRRFFPGPIVGDIQTGQVQGMNGQELSKAGSAFDFIVVGHIYGGTDKEDHHPDEALRSAIPAINQTNPAFLVSLGDMVQYSNTQDFDILDQTLLDHFMFPVFNTVGNHDVEDRSLYEARYGQSYYTFKYGPARFIFLDTEKKKCGLTEPQLEMLTGSVEDTLRDDKQHTLFVFMHKTLFFDNTTLAARKMPLALPNVGDCYDKPFWEIAISILLPAAAQKPVYVFAGDVGAWGNLTPYYERNSEVPLTMLMTGLGDTSQDNMIRVHVDDKQVTLEAIFLRDLSSRPITEFDPSYWEAVAAGNIKLSP